ncbi:stage III sporulation protein E [Bacillus sp. LL01]|nr:stage III sporulation protein E [Bacillus sp. LL01]
MFAQLSDEEEESLEQDYAKKPENKQKQSTAKVAYQYPTGKFRFPLIPDEGVTEQSSKRKKREKTKSPKSSKPPEQKKFDHVKEKPKSELAETTKKSEPEKRKAVHPQKKFEKVTNTSKKPFHPTEVVSPIYGYKSRPPVQKNEEFIPEIELMSKESDLQDIEEHNPLETYPNVNESYAPLVELENEKVQAFSDSLIEENHEPQVVEETVSVMETQEDLNKPLDVEPVIEVVDAEKKWEFVEKEEVQELYSEDESLLDEIEEQKKVEEQPEPVPVFEKKEAETVTYEESAAAVEHVRPIEAKKERQNPEASGPKDSNNKQHIPFNVIMLKQDKRSLERKQQVVTREESTQPYYRKPSITMLSIPPQHSLDDQEWVEAQRQLLDETLHHFRVGAKVVKATQGPSVTQFEVQPEPGVKVNKITNLSDDIKLSLSARDIRMEAPIPGKNTIGIEVPNRVSKPVFIREIIRHPSFIQHTSPLTVALGLDISGQPVVLDLQKMPHGLIAGATGSGKSVCVNSIIMSLLYKSSPDEVKMLLIDPKMVELTPYNHIPHLVSPVITDVKAATAALKWAVEEMERRYELFVHAGVRDIGKYNENAKKHKQETLPYMVIIIDELADLMMVAPSDVEEAICRIAQKARACGMHLLIATQRPSVDVITGLIKANIPTRIAFSVSSQVDSRTIIDIGGAERLLGRGDMLLLENGAPKPIRVQGNFVSDEEIEKTVNHVRKEQKPSYLFEQSELLKESASKDEDELFLEACQYVVDQNGASTSSLQRRFRIGYNRAARLMELMEDHGVISGPKGSKARDVLVSDEELVSMQDSDY